MLLGIRHRRGHVGLPPTLALHPPCPAAAIGFNVETVTYKNIKFQVWDLGGQTSIRPYWRCYYPNTQAIIYVVDSCDADRLPTSREEFQAILEEEELKDAPLLIYANKQVPGRWTGSGGVAGILAAWLAAWPAEWVGNAQWHRRCWPLSGHGACCWQEQHLGQCSAAASKQAGLMKAGLGERVARHSRGMGGWPTGVLRSSGAGRAVQQWELCCGAEAGVALPPCPPQDLPGALSDAKVAEGLGLTSIKSRQWAIFKTSAIKGEGLFEGLDWLSNILKSKPR